jgi:hypothetical protein
MFRGENVDEYIQFLKNFHEKLSFEFYDAFWAHSVGDKKYEEERKEHDRQKTMENHSKLLDRWKKLKPEERIAFIDERKVAIKDDFLRYTSNGLCCCKKMEVGLPIAKKLGLKKLSEKEWKLFCCNKL